MHIEGFVVQIVKMEGVVGSSRFQMGVMMNSLGQRCLLSTLGR